MSKQASKQASKQSTASAYPDCDVAVDSGPMVVVLLVVPLPLLLVPPLSLVLSLAMSGTWRTEPPAPLAGAAVTAGMLVISCCVNCCSA